MCHMRGCKGLGQHKHVTYWWTEMYAHYVHEVVVHWKQTTFNTMWIHRLMRDVDTQYC